MAKFVISFLILGVLVGCSSAEKKEEAQLHLKIGTGYLTHGHYPQAMAELRQAEQMDPDDPTIQNNLGLAYFVRKEYGEAERHLAKAVKTAPQYSEAKSNLARVYIELARYDDAISLLNQVTKDLTYSHPEKAFVNEGLAYLKKGDNTAALNNFKKSLEYDNKFCPGHNYAGQALFQMEKYQAAVESFETALQLCKKYDEAHYFSALSYYKIGQKEKAVARLEEVVKNYPDSEYAAKAKSMLKIIQ